MVDRNLHFPKLISPGALVMIALATGAACGTVTSSAPPEADASSPTGTGGTTGNGGAAGGAGRAGAGGAGRAGAAGTATGGGAGGTSAGGTAGAPGGAAGGGSHDCVIESSSLDDCILR